MVKKIWNPIIETVNLIKKVDVVESIPDTTPKGSEGVAFIQETVAGGGWVNPTAFEDPGVVWSTEAFAYDDNVDTIAYVDPPTLDWSNWLILTRAAIRCNKIRMIMQLITFYNFPVDLDVFKDGAWIHVFEGYQTDTSQEYAFPEGSVTQARIRFYGTATWNAGIAELDFYQIPTSGGQLHVHLYATDDNGVTWTPVACDNTGKLDTV